MADSVIQAIKDFDGSEEELAEFLANYEYSSNDRDPASWYGAETGPHPNSFAALQTVPASVLPRTVLVDVYRRKGAKV